MLRTAVFAVLFAPGIALACPGAEGSTTTAAAAAPAGVDPAHCAKNAGLVGGNCSYTTGMMAQRVLEEGKPYSFTGTLATASNNLESHVAAPFAIGPDAAIHVIANEVVEGITTQDAAGGRVTLSGKLLEVEGLTYFVATDWKRTNS